jgi:DNA polymerase sigma
LLSTLESFDRELQLFIRYIQPTLKSIKQRNSLFNSYKDRIKHIGHTALLFGSSKNLLFLPSSDLDIVIPSNASKSNHKKILLKLKKNFEVKHKVEFIDCSVPLLKFVDPKTGIKIDVSCNEGVAVDAVGVAKHMGEQLKGFGGLVLVLKQFLVNRGLDSNQSFGIGGYGLVLWVGSFLRIHDSIYGQIDEQGPITLKKLDLKGTSIGDDDCQMDAFEQNSQIGILFLHFLHFFGFCFDYHKVGLAPGGSKNDPNRVIISKLEIESKHCFRLAIMDPLDEFNNVTSGSRRTNEIVACFRDAYNSLLGLFDPNENVLERGFLASILNVPDINIVEKNDKNVDKKNVPDINSVDKKVSQQSHKRPFDHERGIDERAVKRSNYLRHPKQSVGKRANKETIVPNYKKSTSDDRIHFYFNDNASQDQISGTSTGQNAQYIQSNWHSNSSQEKNGSKGQSYKDQVKVIKNVIGVQPKVKKKNKLKNVGVNKQPKILA